MEKGMFICTNLNFTKECPCEGEVKTGYKVPDSSEGNMHCDFIILDQNDV